MRILCVCTGNTCRSPMLAALLGARLAAVCRSDIDVHSAGTAADAGSPASAGALRTLRTRGLDFSAHRSRAVDARMLNDADRVLCMTSAHAARVRALGVPAVRIAVVNAEAGGVPDPFGQDDAAYATCAAVLDRAAAALVAELTASAPKP